MSPRRIIERAWGNVEQAGLANASGWRQADARRSSVRRGSSAVISTAPRASPAEPFAVLGASGGSSSRGGVLWCATWRRPRGRRSRETAAADLYAGASAGGPRLGGGGGARLRARLFLRRSTQRLRSTRCARGSAPHAFRRAWSTGRATRPLDARVVEAMSPAEPGRPSRGSPLQAIPPRGGRRAGGTPDGGRPVRPGSDARSPWPGGARGRASRDRGAPVLAHRWHDAGGRALEGGLRRRRGARGEDARPRSSRSSWPRGRDGRPGPSDVRLPSW